MYLIANDIPLFDEICRRFLNFLFNCLNCGSGFVGDVVRHGLTIAGMKSPVGKNAGFCKLHYTLNVSDIGNVKFTNHYFTKWFSSQLEPEVFERASIVKEVIAIREGLLHLSSSVFSKADLAFIIEYLVS